MSETRYPFTICPRCGHHNAVRAKYCASCGLRLPADEAALMGQILGRARRRSRLGLAVAVILLGMAVALLIRVFGGLERRRIHRDHERESETHQVIIHQQSVEEKPGPDPQP